MFAKAGAMLCENLPCGLSGSSLSSDIATQVTCIVLHNAQVSFHLRMLSLVSSFLEVLFFFLPSPHHIGGSSRVAEAMSEVEQHQLEQSKVDDEKRSNPPSPGRSRSPHRKDQALVGGSQAGRPRGNGQDQQVEEPAKPEQPKSLGRVLMETLTTASKSLLECSEKLEKNVVLLEECRADSSSIQSLAAGVNYYASTTKASQAPRPPNIKQMAWDWL